MRSNSVWIVCSGERCEGGDPVSVHESEDTARAAALQVSAHFAGGWKETEHNYWENGCDFVLVHQFRVLP